jgi:class 3 adenylate cyclase
MGIFIGSSKNRSAVRAALGISWAVHKVVRPKLAATWSDLENHYRISHGVGVDTGDAWIVRGGVRGDNDLISVGAAPNVAAKLSSLRRGPSIYVTDAVYNDLSPDLMATNGQAMWARSAPLAVGGKNYGVVSSTWHWAP